MTAPDHRPESPGVPAPAEHDRGTPHAATHAPASVTDPASTAAGDDRPAAARGQRPDRWAHRRGEPRLFALCWTLYLSIASLGVVASAGMGGPLSSQAYRAAARTALCLTAAGIAVLWPMLRLCQERPRRPVRAALVDAMVVSVPAQAVILPQHWLAGWPLDVIAALGALAVAWSLVVGAGLAWWWSLEGRVVTRAGAASAFLLLALLGPGAMLARFLLAGPGPRASDAPADVLSMLSPITGVLELTRDRPASGAATAASAPHAWAIGAAAALGVVGLALTRVRFASGKGAPRGTRPVAAGASDPARTG